VTSPIHITSFRFDANANRLHQHLLRAQKSREPPAKQSEKQTHHRTHAKTPAFVGVISAIARRSVGSGRAGGERRQLGARREQSVIKRVASFIFPPLAQPPSAG